MDNQIARGKRSIIVDANLFLAFDPVIQKDIQDIVMMVSLP